MKKLPLVVVEWDDTTTYSEWAYGDISDESTSHCVSVGWVIKKDKTALTLAGMRDTQKKDISNSRTHIPRGCIRSIRRLE